MTDISPIVHQTYLNEIERQVTGSTNLRYRHPAFLKPVAGILVTLVLLAVLI